MPTLAQFRHEMYRRDRAPEPLGRLFNIASLTERSVTVTVLATGMDSAGKYVGQYLLRPDAASAVDRVRKCDDFSSLNGALGHEGTDYLDTTGTSETLEVLRIDPHYVDQAIQFALSKARFVDRDFLPANQQGAYYLSDIGSWVKGPSDIANIGLASGAAELNRNRRFLKWNGDDGAGSLVPDNWTLAGAGGTFSRSTNTALGPYALSAERSGTDLTVGVTIGLLETGVSADSLRGTKVVGVVVGLTSDASHLRVSVLDGAGTTNSDYHTGGGGEEELTAERTISASATTLTLQAQIKNADAVAIIRDLYLVQTAVTDEVRRNRRQIDWQDLSPLLDQLGSDLRLDSFRGTGAQLVVETYRPYAQFDSTRVLAGSADGDPSDAPLELVAEGALAYLYRGRNEALAALHERNFKELQAQHYINTRRGSKQGLELPQPYSGPVPMRVG